MDTSALILVPNYLTEGQQALPGGGCGAAADKGARTRQEDCQDTPPPSSSDLPTHHHPPTHIINRGRRLLLKGAEDVGVGIVN